MNNSKCTPSGSTSFEVFSNDMERVFDSLVGRAFGPNRHATRPTSSFQPALDVIENDQQFSVTVDIPGVPPGDVEVEAHDGKLTIRGERKHQEEDSEATTYHRLERTFGEFKRVLSLPKDVDQDQITADYHFGQLVVTLPKVEKQQPKKIEIRTGS